VPEVRAVIADDEPLARRGIRQLLAAHPDVVVVAEARDGVEVLEALRAHPIDLVFLDVQMPRLDGLAAMRSLGSDWLPLVVLVTAYDGFAVEAFALPALDYLVKPVNEERFAATLARVRERLRLAALETKGARRLVVPTGRGELVLDVDEIDWIEADDYYAAVHARGARHLVRESLASLEARLDGTRFLRVHRSAIVRLDGVRELRTGEEPVVVLRDGTRVPVSRRRRERIREALRGGPG
jgi:two-component system LytT family response regulator